MKTYPSHTRYVLLFIGILFFSNDCTSKEDGTDNEEVKPNIIFLISDDQSVPDLGVYGNAAIHTPHLDRLAGQGILFTRAYVASSQCSPSRASILLGRPPHAVGASRLHEEAQQIFPSLVELLKQAGYYTGAYRKVHQQHIRSQFDFYGSGNEPFTSFFEARPADTPFFLWFGSRDPHRPYNTEDYDYLHDPEKIIVQDYLPDTKAVREDIANYYNEITRFDKECGRLLALLEERGLSENTLVVMTSDNGMPFPRAKATLYEAGIHVPLIIKWPGRIKAGRISEALVSLTDLTPTWLEAAGIPIPEGMKGMSLLPLLEGATSEHRTFVFAERNWHDNWDPVRAVIGKRYKLIQNYRPNVHTLHTLDRLSSPTWKAFKQLKAQGRLSERLHWYFAESKPRVELYDLEHDPGEWNNLAKNPEYDSLITRYQQVLANWMNETHDFLPPPKDAFPRGSGFNEIYDVLNAEEF